MFKGKILGIIFVFFAVFSLQAQEHLMPQDPIQTIELENNIVVSNLVGDKLLVGTDFGEVLEIDLKTGIPTLVAKLPSIENFYTSASPKVYSVDKMDEKILILSEGNYGAKNLYLLENGNLLSLDFIESPSLKKVAFVEKDKIFLGFSSNEIALYDLAKQKELYHLQLSEASFSDFALDLEKKHYVVACESGILYYGNLVDGAVIKELEGANKDNVYQVKFSNKNDKVSIISAGQDRHVGVYQLDLKTKQSSFYTLEARFLVYSAGLSSNGEIGAYMENEQSDIVLFSIDSKEPIARLSGHSSLLNNIIFIDDTQLLSSEDGKKILIWER